MAAATSMTRKTRLLWTCAVAVSLLVIIVGLKGPSSPSGRFVADPGISYDGDLFWEFADGKVSLVADSGKRDSFGTYAKSKDGWIWMNDPGRGKPTQLRVECSWFGLRFYSETGEQVLGMRRRLVPFVRPYWMVKWDWMQ
jgi:hypothetical protein